VKFLTKISKLWVRLCYTCTKTVMKKVVCPKRNLYSELIKTVDALSFHETEKKNQNKILIQNLLFGLTIKFLWCQLSLIYRRSMNFLHPRHTRIYHHFLIFFTFLNIFLNLFFGRCLNASFHTISGSIWTIDHQSIRK
jgi:hypothetical protein